MLAGLFWPVALFGYPVGNAALNKARNADALEKRMVTQVGCTKGRFYWDFLFFCCGAKKTIPISRCEKGVAANGADFDLQNCGHVQIRRRWDRGPRHLTRRLCTTIVKPAVVGGRADPLLPDSVASTPRLNARTYIARWAIHTTVVYFHFHVCHAV